MEEESYDVFARALLCLKECQLAQHGIKAELRAVKIESAPHEETKADVS